MIHKRKLLARALIAVVTFVSIMTFDMLFMIYIFKGHTNLGMIAFIGDILLFLALLCVLAIDDQVKKLLFNMDPSDK